MEITKEKVEQITSELSGIVKSEGQPKGTQCQLKVKLDRHMERACSIREYEEGGHYGFAIRLNPKRIRTENKLEQHLNFCREMLLGS